MRKTETKTAIGPENAIALYGLIPIRRASSNCRSMKPMRAKEIVERHKKPQSPPSWTQWTKSPWFQDPKVEEENDP